MLNLRTLALFTLTTIVASFGVNANAATARQYINAMNTWIGEDIETLVGQWGNPIKQDALANGNYEVFYQSSTPYYHAAVPDTYVQHCQGGGCGAWQLQSEGHDAYYSYTACYTAFEVNDGMIVKWRWQGDCKN